MKSHLDIDEFAQAAKAQFPNNPYDLSNNNRRFPRVFKIPEFGPAVITENGFLVGSHSVEPPAIAIWKPRRDLVRPMNTALRYYPDTTEGFDEALAGLTRR